MYKNTPHALRALVLGTLLTTTGLGFASANTTTTTHAPATTVEANDAMQFNTKEIQVSKACKEFTVTLKHTGTQPKESMGHNIVIGKAEDMDGIFKDGAGAAATDYVKADDARVVAHTKLVGGGEEASLTLDPAKLAGGEYKFACTFPGHGALMNGKVTLVD